VGEGHVVNSTQVRAYDAMLRLYPRRFRAEYRREMTLLFSQQLEDARSTDGALGVIELWIRTLVDVVGTAPTEHLEKDVLVAQPIAGVEGPPIKPDWASRIAWNWITVALVPGLTVLTLTTIGRPHFMDPMFQKPPELLGLPLGTVIMGLSAIWYGAGVAIVGVASRPGSRLVAILVFIFPATLALLLGPAVILILQNLAS